MRAHRIGKLSPSFEVNECAIQPQFLRKYFLVLKACISLHSQFADSIFTRVISYSDNN